MDTIERIPRPHAVYRFYDKDGILLYVGVSYKVLHRLDHHKSTKDWFWKITRIELEWFPSWGPAAGAEVRAILAENPVHNKRR